MERRQGSRALRHAGRAPRLARPRRRRPPQVGAARGGARAGPAARHLDLRPDARQERTPEPAPPRRHRPRVPAGSLRPHQLGAAPRPRDRPPARALGAHEPARPRPRRGPAAAGLVGANRGAQRGAAPGRPAGELGSPARPRRPSPAARDPGRLGRGLQRDAALAREWQLVVRRAFESAFARGYAAVDVATTPGAPTVAYVLERITPGPSRRAAPGRKTTRSRTPRKASRAGRRGAEPAGRGRR